MAVDGRRRVIGCVWGAWRALQDRLGEDDAPGYDWCELEWRRAPADALPPVGDKKLPTALEMYLEQAWLDHGQTSLF
jgi:hypothetical protein